ncbi:hypothetical protein [Candidatus Poriferisodalis sp.]|uniref:hypothetical protein n=1 Tax=Candidatus Poriferisodalis sp. TaxID=3101277 RepID=UPI003B5CC699
MTPAGPVGYPAEDRSADRGGLPRHGPEPWRIGAAVLIVGTVVLAIWLWGRPHAEPPTVLAAVASEPWTAGQPPGAFEVVEIAAQLADRFADPDSIVTSVASHDVPPGTFVTPGLLGNPGDATGDLTAMRFAADTSAWPEPGPRAGSRAVVASVLGGCALDVTTLAGGAEGSIVVHVDAADAARYARAAELDGLVAWPAPPDGWPECRSPWAAGTVPSAFSSRAPSGLSSDSASGFGGALPPTQLGDPAGG